MVLPQKSVDHSLLHKRRQDGVRDHCSTRTQCEGTGVLSLKSTWFPGRSNAHLWSWALRGRNNETADISDSNEFPLQPHRVSEQVRRSSEWPSVGALPTRPSSWSEASGLDPEHTGEITCLIWSRNISGCRRKKWKNPLNTGFYRGSFTDFTQRPNGSSWGFLLWRRSNFRGNKPDKVRDVFFACVTQRLDYTLTGWFTTRPAGSD